MLEDGLATDGVEVIDGRMEGDDFGDGWSSGFVAKRDGSEGEAIVGDAIDHAAATEPGRHVFEMFSLAVEDSDAVGAEHLVSAEGEEIGVHGLNVDSAERDGLGCVDN